MIALALLACGRDPDAPGTDGTTTGDTGTVPTSATGVGPILERRCAPCHLGNPSPFGGLALDRAEDYVGAPDPESGLAYVEPGDPERSYLWLKLLDRQAEVPGGDGGPMPPTGRLPADELAAIEAWILAGAPATTATPTDGCPPAAAACTEDCPPGPTDVVHGPWHDRLTTSPALAWDEVPGALRYEVALGTAAGLDDVACWTDVGDATSHTFTALAVADGALVVPTVRAVHEGDRVSAGGSSAGWTVDILPPDVPSALDDRRASVDGHVAWAHPRTDRGSGFVGFEVAVGTSPFGDDAVPWTPAGDALEATLADPLPAGAWYWLSVRALDVAGNASQPGTSAGFVACPEAWAFVPGDAELGTTPFCLARYEMRVQGLQDGNVGFDPAHVAESRATGTPWAGVDKSSARVACDALGFDFQLVSNAQWQAVARSVERTAANWSGGAMGQGTIPRGHCDEDPLLALASDGGPCGGTGNPRCDDPSSPDWSQRRVHVLENGEEVWDLAGNLREQVDGSPGAPAGLWMSFDDPPFTTDPGFEDARLAFAPAGPFTDEHGVGRVYGGSGNATRGGSFDPDGQGSGGSRNDLDVGVFAVHHNTWSTGPTEGFRCVFVPM